MARLAGGLCLTAGLSEMHPAQGEPNHQTEPSETTPWTGDAGSVSRMAEELALVLGCRVELTYVQDSREIVVVAHPEPGREVRVTLRVPIALPLIDDHVAELKYDVLKELRRQMSRKPTDG
jgi:hypothetical protein